MSSLSSPQDRSPRRDVIPLDARIYAVEQRLVSRERWLASRIDALGERMRVATRPRNMVPAAVGTGVALLALWWALRRRVPARTAAPGPTAHAGGGNTSWAHWLALAWPLVPAAWRARINPASAAALVSVGIPLVERLLARPTYAPLATMAQLDLARYAGTWYEIARLPTPFEASCDDQPRAHYAVQRDGLLVRNICRHRGTLRSASGVARVLPRSGNAKLELSLWPAWLRWLPLAWSDYWVLHVDPAYQIALVGHPDRRHLWLLSRRQRIDAPQLGALVRFAAEQGFPTDRLIVSQRT
jgi:apolipoprotein D and lipocalin family protein